MGGAQAKQPVQAKGSVMQIQINTDETVEGGDALSAKVKASVHARLDRFKSHITRIEVHLSDQDGHKSGVADKRCMIEARLEGRQPQVVIEQAATLEAAYSGATKKLQSALKTTLGKLGRMKGADTIRTSDH